MNRILICITLLLWTFIHVSAQSSVDELSESTIKTLDKIFESYQEKEMPGLIAGAVTSKGLAYGQVLGYEDMDEKKAVSESSVFQLGEISKLFTKYVVLSLVEDGKIKMIDNIINHIDGLPDSYRDITIYHLMANTSGLYDYKNLSSFLPMKHTLPLTDGEVMKMISAQKDLAFQPGTQFLQSRSNAFLLARICESVSDKNLSQLVKEYVFEPLGVGDSQCQVDRADVTASLALPYVAGDNDNYTIADHHYHVSGVFNVYASFRDLVIWYKSYFGDNQRHRRILSKLNSHAKLDNGAIHTTGLGKLTLGGQHVHLERGINKTWQYSTTENTAHTVFIFRSKEMVFFAISHNGEPYNGQLSMGMADIVLKPGFDKHPLPDINNIKAVELPVSKMKKYTGEYWNADFLAKRKIITRNDSLIYMVRGREIPLIPVADNKFQLKMESEYPTYFEFSDDGDGLGYQYKSGDSEFQKYYKIDYAPSPAKEDLIGTYVNTDYDVIYKVISVEDNLKLVSFGSGEVSLDHVTDRLYQTDSNVLWAINFTETKGVTTGITLSGEGFRDLIFNKVKRVEQ